MINSAKTERLTASNAPSINKVPVHKDPPNQNHTQEVEQKETRKNQKGATQPGSSRVPRLPPFNRTVVNGVVFVVHLEFTIMVQHGLKLRGRQAPETLRIPFLLIIYQLQP